MTGNVSHPGTFHVAMRVFYWSCSVWEQLVVLGPFKTWSWDLANACSPAWLPSTECVWACERVGVTDCSSIVYSKGPGWLYVSAWHCFLSSGGSIVSTCSTIHQEGNKKVLSLSISPPPLWADMVAWSGALLRTGFEGHQIEEPYYIN